MTITATRVDSNVALNVVQGRHLDDAASPAAKTITVGFVPRKIVWNNLTDRISYEWVTGNANGTTLKTVAAGTRTLDTGDAAISVTSTNTGGGATNADNYPPRVKATTVITIAAAAILQNKANSFEIYE